MMTLTGKTTFAELFKKYRLRSEIETLSVFGDLLAEEGLVYETSLFTKWQNGVRVPKNRNTLLTIIRLFSDKGGIKSLNDANILLESAGQGYMTQSELQTISFLNSDTLFQAPRRIYHFVGREKYIKQIIDVLSENKIVLIHGQPGIGKTVLAIEVAHTLSKLFPDGVLWYQLDSSSPMEILASIAQLYGENIKNINDISIRSSIVRSLTMNKKILFIFDNADENQNLDALLPSSSSNGVLITSLSSCFQINEIDERIFLQTFTLDETYLLFETLLGQEYIHHNRKEIEKLFHTVEGHPLALQIISKYILYDNKNIHSFIDMLPQNFSVLSKFSYKNKSLDFVLNASFQKLTKEEQEIFTSTSIFSGRDFSIEIIGYMNDISSNSAHQYLEKFRNLSLLEHSTEGRYRLHPLIKLFLFKKIKTIKYIKAAKYYITIFDYQRINRYFFNTIEKELGNILPILRRLFLLRHWTITASLWKCLSAFLWHRGYWHELEWYGNRIYKLSSKYNDTETKISVLIQNFSILFYWKGEILLAEKYAKEGLTLASQINNESLINFAKQKLGRILVGKNELTSSINLLLESLQYFILKKDAEQLTNAYMYLGEASLRKSDLIEALRYFTLALIHAAEISMKDIRLIYTAIIALYLGEIYLLQNKFSEAKKYFTEAISHCIKSKENSGNITRAYIGLGLCYEKKNVVKLASDYYQKGLRKLQILGTKSHLNIHNDTFYYSLQALIKNSTIFKSILN